jgi:hypothetical protein
VRAISVSFTGAADSGNVLANTAPLFEMFPLNLLLAVIQDRLAVALLLTGLIVGYLLSSVSDRRTTQVYSAFWHRHRPSLRAALRRTPAPSDATLNAASAQIS